MLMDQRMLRQYSIAAQLLDNRKKSNNWTIYCQNRILTNSYLDMLKLYTVPQLFQPWVIFEQDGPPPRLFFQEIFY